MSSKTKKLVFMAVGLFGALAIIAAFFRAMSDVKADTSGATTLGASFISELKAVGQFSS
jgi:hypothetical protein